MEDSIEAVEHRIRGILEDVIRIVAENRRLRAAVVKLADQSGSQESPTAWKIRELTRQRDEALESNAVLGVEVAKLRRKVLALGCVDWPVREQGVSQLKNVCLRCGGVMVTRIKHRRVCVRCRNEMRKLRPDDRWTPQGGGD